MLKNFDCLIHFYNDKWNKRKILTNEPFDFFFLCSPLIGKKKNGPTSVQTSTISFQTK
jgi:hypothetical protein